MTRITGTLLEDEYTFLIITRSIHLITRNVFDKVVEKIKTHFLFRNFVLMMLFVI